MRAADNLKGLKFGKLTVIKREENNKQGGARWFCSCDCGGYRVASAHRLKLGDVKSCGCLWSIKRPYEALYNHLLYTANRRNVGINLTYDEFLEFVNIKKCHYCNILIEWTKHLNGTSLRTNMDRKNNDMEYNKENIVVCCTDCNRTKGDRFTYEEFMLLAPTLKEIRNLRKKRLDTGATLCYTA
jgi:5-methylcytosine-specific restriction endonuclease McrA